MGYPGDWDESMEMPELIIMDDTYSLFYCGYDPLLSQSVDGLVWGDLGLAESSDGQNFTKVGDPVMSRTLDWYDQDGITDPTIVQRNDTLFMIYVGWCTQGCTLNNGFPAFYSLTAISVDEGHSWEKLGLRDPTGLIGLQHPDLMLDADGHYSLFKGVDYACDEENVGIYYYTADQPFGPFELVSEFPIFCMGTQDFENEGTDGAFPSVINDNGVGRMYYTGVDETNFYFKIGLIESNVFVNIQEWNGEITEPNVFPNPTINQLTIQFPHEFIGMDCRLMNEMGQEVWSIKSIRHPRVVIDIEAFAKGIYVVVFYAEGKTSTQKVIVK